MGRERTGGAAARRARVARDLPRGPHASPPDVVLMSQHARLLEAAVEVVAEKGYPATTVGDITRRARVSRTTFYEQFQSKEDCFLAAYEAGAHGHYEHVTAAVRRTEGWSRSLREGLRAYVEVLTARPAYARTFLLEVHKAGERALERRLETHRRYVDLIHRWHQGGPRPRADVPDEFYVGAVAAINEVVVERLRSGDVGDDAELADTLARMVLGLLGVADR